MMSLVGTIFFLEHNTLNDIKIHEFIVLEYAYYLSYFKNLYFILFFKKMTKSIFTNQAIMTFKRFYRNV